MSSCYLKIAEETGYVFENFNTILLIREVKSLNTYSQRTRICYLKTIIINSS
jgi:hypothetical protein